MPVAEVTVVVPVHNGAATLGRCLDGLAAQETDVGFDVVVVDNASTDGTALVAQRHRVGARVVAEPRRGSYAARNAGLAASSGAVVAFTDADCVPAPGWLSAGLAAVRAGAGLVGGAIAMDRSVDAGVVERYDRAVYLRQRDLVENSGWAVTANLFVRRAVFDTVGPFAASLPSSGDREFCLRATAAGFTLSYAPDAVVGHAPRTSLREIWRVNRRIGRGLAALADAGGAPPWRSAELRQPLSWVVQCVAEDGPPLRRRQLVGVHAVAMAGRWAGLLTAR